MNRKAIAGWILSTLVAAFLIFGSAYGKFFDFPDKDKMFSHLGWGQDVMKTIGVIEVAVALLFLVPHTAFVAAILLAAYLGGAVATHVRVGDPASHIAMPIVMGVLAWIALGLRDGRVFRNAFMRPNSDSSAAN